VHGLIEAHRIDQPAVAGPTLIGDLEPVRDLPLKVARLALIHRDQQLANGDVFEKERLPHA
jgi:hypothetical protein